MNNTDSICREQYSVDISKQKKEYIVCNNGVYFKLELSGGEVLQRFINGVSIESISEEFNVTTTEVNSFIRELIEKGVIGRPHKEKKKILFYKIPIYDVDGIISKLSNNIVKNIDISKLLFVLLNIIIVVGVPLFALKHNEIFTLSTFKLSIIQYVYLSIAGIVIIILHETAHALTCRLMEGKVGKVGIIFIFFMPAFYCDISGVRMVVSKFKQVLTSFAGIYMNIFLMSLATIFYYITDDKFYGMLILINFTMITSNIIPFIKLDGYWMLSFFSGITNLYDKSLHNVKLLFVGKNVKERFIGGYGITNYIFILFFILGMLISFYKAIYFFLSEYDDKTRNFNYFSCCLTLP